MEYAASTSWLQQQSIPDVHDTPNGNDGWKEPASNVAPGASGAQPTLDLSDFGLDLAGEHISQRRGQCGPPLFRRRGARRTDHMRTSPQRQPRPHCRNPRPFFRSNMLATSSLGHRAHTIHPRTPILRGHPLQYLKYLYQVIHRSMEPRTSHHLLDNPLMGTARPRK